MPSQAADDVDMGNAQVNGETAANDFDPSDDGALPRDNDIRLKLVSMRRKIIMYIATARLIPVPIVTW